MPLINHGYWWFDKHFSPKSASLYDENLYEFSKYNDVIVFEVSSSSRIHCWISVWDFLMLLQISRSIECTNILFLLHLRTSSTQFWRFKKGLRNIWSYKKCLSRQDNDITTRNIIEKLNSFLQTKNIFSIKIHIMSLPN